MRIGHLVENRTMNDGYLNKNNTHEKQEQEKVVNLS